MGNKHWDNAQELTWMIAKQVGYKSVNDHGEWFIVHPSGTRLYTEDTTSEKGAVISSLYHYGPGWLANADTAITLPLGKDHYMDVQVYAIDRVSCQVRTMDTDSASDSFEGKFAFAYCQAWLDWKAKS